MFRSVSIAFATVVLLGLPPASDRATAAGDVPLAGSGGSERAAPARGPRTVLEWILGIEPAKPEKGQSAEEDRLDPDRPHFPEATTTVGKGRAVLEAGYTLTTKGSSYVSHAYPEALLRVGMLADWFEVRVGQSFLNQQQTAAGITTNTAGAQDVYLGVKLALTPQQGVLPAIAVIPQMTAPTGSRAVTASHVLPGLNVDFSWELVKDFFGLEVLVANNQIKDDLGGFRRELATGVTGIFQITKQLEVFAEWDAYYPSGGTAPNGPQHYAVGGLVYFITSNFEVDARAGVGLNSRSNDFLAGLGFSARY